MLPSTLYATYQFLIFLSVCMWPADNRIAALKSATPNFSAGKVAPPAAKWGLSGGITQSFARAAAWPPVRKSEMKEEEDIAMALSDDSEANDDYVPTAEKRQLTTPRAYAKLKEHKAELRRIKEDEDKEGENSGKEKKNEDENMGEEAR
jgi:DNA polymerase delta subunit 3